MSYGVGPYGNWGYGIAGDTTAPVVTVLSVTRTKISGEVGFDSTTIEWSSNEDGTYQVEVEGTGKGFGYFVETSGCYSGVAVETIVTDNIIEDSNPTLSDGVYRINIYVTDAAGNTTPYYQ